MYYYIFYSQHKSLEGVTEATKWRLTTLDLWLTKIQPCLSLHFFLISIQAIFLPCTYNLLHWSLAHYLLFLSIYFRSFGDRKLFQVFLVQGTKFSAWTVMIWNYEVRITNLWVKLEKYLRVTIPCRNRLMANMEHY